MIMEVVSNSYQEASNSTKCKPSENWYVSQGVAYTMMYLDSTIAATYIIFVLYLFVLPYFIQSRAPVKTDLRAKVIIFTYFLSSTLSCINWIFYVHDTNGIFFTSKREYLVEFFDLITVEIVVLNLQLIVFEMYSLYYTLTCENKVEN